MNRRGFLKTCGGTLAGAVVGLVCGYQQSRAIPPRSTYNPALRKFLDSGEIAQAYRRTRQQMIDMIVGRAREQNDVRKCSGECHPWIITQSLRGNWAEFVWLNAVEAKYFKQIGFRRRMV